MFGTLVAALVPLSFQAPALVVWCSLGVPGLSGLLRLPLGTDFVLSASTISVILVELVYSTQAADIRFARQCRACTAASKRSRKQSILEALAEDIKLGW